jgi:hypothetical protein
MFLFLYDLDKLAAELASKIQLNDKPRNATPNLSESSLSATEIFTKVHHYDVQFWWDKRENFLFKNKQMCIMPPTSKRQGKEDWEESVVEKDFFSNFENIFKMAPAGACWWDGHNRPWLRRPSNDSTPKAPDWVFSAATIVGNNLPNPQLVIGFNDNKGSRSGAFSNEDKGKLIRDLATVVEYHQKTRRDIGGSLFDGRYAQCFLLKKNVHGGFELDQSPVMDCNTDNEAAQFASFLTSPRAYGWYMNDIPAISGDLIGSGSIGLVFKNKNGDGVVKFCKTGGNLWFQKERENLLALKSLPLTVCMLRQRDDSPTTGVYMLLSPLCTSSLYPWRYDANNLELIATLVKDTLKPIHEAGFAHCDLRPENILVNSSGQLVLCDFGAARKTNDLLLYEHGTFLFASVKVRKAWIDKNPLFIMPSDDLESIVYVALCLSFVNINQYGEMLGKRGDMDSVAEFWDTLLRYRQAWAQLLESARKGDHADVVNRLMSLSKE